MRRAPTLLAPLALLAGCADPADAPDGPAGSRVRNVLLFTVDTLRADQLGCYGHAGDPTPAADRLAAEGLLFERAYAQATLTNSSLTSILTGLLPIQTGVHVQSDTFAPGILPIPLLLQAEGIATGSFIANMCHRQGVPDTVFHDGWDERFCGMLDDPANYSDQYLWDEAVTGAALEWIEGTDGAWFCWVHLMDPHAEHRPPARHWNWDRDAPREKQDQYQYYAGFEERREIPPDDVVDRLFALYSAEITGSDDQLGRMLDALRARDDWDETAVVFSSDHGEELFETWHRYDHGMSATEGVFHVPLIVRAPGVAPGRERGIVEALQIAPTLLDLFDVEPPRELAGPSLLAERPSRGFAMSYVGDISTSIRGGKYRYWLRHTPEPFEREFTPWRHEAPWFEEQRVIATYSDSTGNLPHWGDPADPLLAEPLRKLESTILQRHAAAERGVGRQVLSGDTAEKLRALGYSDEEITGGR